MYTLNNIVICIGTLVILISFIIALLMPKSNRVYMKGFFFCSFIALLTSINTICTSFFLLYSLKICFLIQNILIIADLLFWTLFFMKLLKERNILKKIILLFICTLLLAIYLFYSSDTEKPNLQVLGLVNICKSIFCIFFYYKIFTKLPNQNILLEPSFWIISGLIFYSCLSLPFYALNNYIKIEFPPLISYNIFSISNILIIIMYIFFIKAYLCTIRLSKA